MLKDIITLDCINIDLKATTKSEVIDEIIDILYKAIAAECRSVVPELKKICRDNIPQNAETPFILVLITDTDSRRCLANRQRV